MIPVVVDIATKPYFSNLVDIFLSNNYKKEGLLADKLHLTVIGLHAKMCLANIGHA